MFLVLNARILPNRNDQYITSKVGLFLESETMMGHFPHLTLNSSSSFWLFLHNNNLSVRFLDVWILGIYV
jgi:hypothetical protein